MALHRDQILLAMVSEQEASRSVPPALTIGMLQSATYLGFRLDQILY